MKLTGENVNKVMEACLMNPETTEWVDIEGVQLQVRLDKARVEAHREEILEMLGELPEEFMAGKGGGMSFLNMCLDKDGRQWTGLHVECDALVVLGRAVGAVEFFLSDRETWVAFPGGMPYIIINLNLYK